jgi:hypothetical protein
MVACDDKVSVIGEQTQLSYSMQDLTTLKCRALLIDTIHAGTVCSQLFSCNDKSFEDDVMIALNGQEVMSLPSCHEINYEGVQSHTNGGNSDAKCNNINVTYGYAKQGFESETNEDGLHLPTILNNIKRKPLIGKQYLALSNFIADFDPDEKHYNHSSNLFHAHNKYP